MQLLYVNACPRGAEESRTYALGEAFLAAYRKAHPQTEIIRHDLSQLSLLPLDGDALKERDALIDARVWTHPLFDAARAFQAADAVVVAAPYWDLMFPSMLKVYIEHVFIREMTFCYRDDEPVGLCRGRRALYITTAGSPIGKNDFGTEYLRATFAMLGIPCLESVAAEGIDIAGAPVEAILARARESLQTLAAGFDL